VTYPVYYIFGKLPKFFNFCGGMVKSYSVELKLSRKSRFLNREKFHRITFLQTFLFELAHLMLHACKKSGWVTKQNFEIKTNVLCTFYFLFEQFYAVFLLPVLCTHDFYKKFRFTQLTRAFSSCRVRPLHNVSPSRVIG